MNIWNWLHPISGGAILVNMSNVCYFVGDENNHAKLVLANGEKVIVYESEDYILNTLKGK